MFASKSLIQPGRTKFRNLILLFFTIVFGLGTVMVFADLNIQTSIQNARQTIQRITITSDGTDSGTTLMDINSGGKLYISTSLLNLENSFSGKVLGLDNNDQVIYVDAAGLVVSGAGGGDDGDWTTTGNDIYRGTGNVGIGTAPATGKLYVTSSGEAELALEETNSGNAANIHFINPVRTWTIGGDSAPDLFYIGLLANPLLSILANGSVGIGTTVPKATLQIVGNLLVGNYNNYVNGSTSVVIGGHTNTGAGTATSVIGGMMNNVTADYSFIGGGQVNTVYGYNNAILGGYGNDIKANRGASFIGGGHTDSIDASYAAIIGGSSNTIKNTSGAGGDFSFIGGGNAGTIVGTFSTIVGGQDNGVTGNFSTIIGGNINSLYGENSFLGGGLRNNIQGATKKAAIVGGTNNTITGSDLSFIGGGQSNGISQGSTNFIGGGNTNTINGASYSTILGGRENSITGTSLYASILGGRSNTVVDGRASSAGGFDAHALHNNVFIWNASNTTSFSSSKENTFLINASNGIGINTSNPMGDLHIGGSGVIIFTPQSETPQGTTGYHIACPTTGAVMYSSNMNTLCYCDGITWKTVSSNDRCTI